MSDPQAPPHPTWAYNTPSQWNAIFEPFIARIVALEAKNERLKCCGNCEHDRAVDDCCDDCTVNESRWAERSAP